MSPRTVAIQYRRLPDKLDVYRQYVVDHAPERIVTFHPSAPVRQPSVVDGKVILEPRSPVIWFTYPGVWYDAGRFYLPNGTFTGTYANILTPVVIAEDGWSTTDLCLDVWVGADGSVRVLDREDFEHAVRSGWMDESTAEQALKTAQSLEASARSGSWPPPELEEWTLLRALAAVG